MYCLSSVSNLYVRLKVSCFIVYLALLVLTFLRLVWLFTQDNLATLVSFFYGSICKSVSLEVVHVSTYDLTLLCHKH